MTTVYFSYPMFTALDRCKQENWRGRW